MRRNRNVRFGSKADIAESGIATRLDFGVAAYAKDDDGVGITCILRVRVFVNPQRAPTTSVHSVSTDQRNFKRHSDANDVRFTPKSGHQEALLGCPLCAKSGH